MPKTDTTKLPIVMKLRSENNGTGWNWEVAWSAVSRDYGHADTFEEAQAAIAGTFKRGEQPL